MAVSEYVVPGQNDFLSRGILCHSEAMKLFQLVIGREMRIPLAKNGQRAANVICLVPNTVAVNSFILYKIDLIKRDDLKLWSVVIQFLLLNAAAESPVLSTEGPFNW